MPQSFKTNPEHVFESAKNLSIENIMPRFERTFLSAGTMLGHYRIIDEIDRGGMSVVYKAEQMDLGRDVALKILPANITINRKFVERFLAEAHAVARLTHPNIVNIHEVAMLDNIYYIAMDFIPGKNLYYYLNFQKPKLVDVVEIVAQLADALDYAHAQKIVHRDLKLNNVIMRDRLLPVLIDFGLAKALEADEGAITQSGEVMGSPAYMAPERLSGGVTDARSDICSLGIMLYEMLTFKNPYLDPRSLQQTAYNVLNGNPLSPRKLVPWLPREMEAITLKAMAYEKDARYQTMGEFRDDIRRYQRGESVVARPPSLGVKALKIARRHTGVLIAGAVSCLCIIVLVLAMIQQKGRETATWQPVFSEPFTHDLDTSLWAFSDSLEASPSDRGWTIQDGSLTVHGCTPAHLLLKKIFTRDVRIEFDLSASDNRLYNIGCFLYGSNPESGYRAYLFPGQRAVGALSFPGRSYMFDNGEIPRPDANGIYHVVITRRNRQVTLMVGDHEMASITDVEPLIGANYYNMGFFSDGGMARIDNMTIYRLAIPQITTRTAAADRFLERGDIVAALDEYQALLTDFPGSQEAPRIMLDIAECLSRLNLPAADSLLASLSKNTADQTICDRARMMMSLRLFRRGEFAPACSSLAKLFTVSDNQELLKGSFDLLMTEAYQNLQNGPSQEVMDALRMALERFPDQRTQGASLCAAIARQYAERGKMSDVITFFVLSNGLYERDLVYGSEFKRIVAQACLHTGDMARARELLNECVGIPENVPATWQAWLDLADLYEYELRRADAEQICKRVWRSAPRNLPYPWDAAVRMAWFSSCDTLTDYGRSLLDSVNQGAHSFALTRMQSQLFASGAYLGSDSIRCAMLLSPFDQLTAFARAKVLHGQTRSALISLMQAQKSVQLETWDAKRLNRLATFISSRCSRR